MYPSVEELRNNYERYDDKTLIRIATEEAAKLRPEALTILKEVIKERGLSEGVISSINVQIKPIDELTLATYTNLLRSQPCPVCHSASEKLNATIVATTMSFCCLLTTAKN